MASSDFEGRLIIASNRLPVSVKCKGDGTYDFTPSSGGLVTGLSGLAKSGVQYLWYGWPGMEIPQNDIPQVTGELLGKHDTVPVLLDRETAEQYYDGFSNSTIWPLFHDQLDKVVFDKNTSAAYRKANEVFADTIAPQLRDGDHVWVHDYHLMLLPLLLRQRAKRANINVRLGWFLHTPFPDEDAFAILPSKTDILNGVLGADLVGFQTDEARRNFLNVCPQDAYVHPSNARSSQQKPTNYSVSRLADTEVWLDGREVSVGTFPIGVEPSEFHDRLRMDDVQDMIRSMRARFDKAKVIVGVDRLDCIKGVPQKFHAFNKFLEKHPEWVGRATLVQVAIPSRANLETHQTLLAEIQKLVGKINGKYGRINYVPIQFIYNSIPPAELTALYTTADICFVSSTRDGMNLVSYEYVACHNAKAVQASREAIAPGALILSRFAGAAGILKGALVVNPWDREGCAEALAHAASMGADEAGERMRKLGDKVEERTSRKWGADFLRALTQQTRYDSSQSVSRSSSENEGLVLDLKKASSNLGRTDSVMDDESFQKVDRVFGR